MKGVRSTLSTQFEARRATGRLRTEVQHATISFSVFKTRHLQRNAYSMVSILNFLHTPSAESILFRLSYLHGTLNFR
jgi:hypothetical protein